MFEVLIFSLIVMLASLTGVFTVWKNAGKFIESNLRFLVSFSAGVFLVVAYQLGKEAVEHAETVTSGFLWILIGAIVIWLVFKIMPGFHHHHDENEEDHPHSKIDARRILASDAIHNIGDGVLLAAAFAINIGLGIVTAISIFVHELVQEVSEFFVLRQAGFSTKKSLALNFSISGTILIGSLGGFLLLESFEALEVPLLGVAAGSFLVVVLHDLIPHSVRTSKIQTNYTKHAFWFLLGIILMIGVNAFMPHSEAHENRQEEDSHLEY
jgi:zinc and cadmium transporter